MAEPVCRIEPPRGWGGPGLDELWSYRELLWFFVWRDVKVRYKQTALGSAWAIIQPFFTMVVFSVFFGRLAGMPSDGLPYPVFAYAALVPWTFFANGLTRSSGSLVAGAMIIRSVYFPRLALPIATVVAEGLDFTLALAVLVGLMLFYGTVPSAHVVWLPFFLLLTFVTSLGVGVWLSAINVRFRDVRHAVPFLVQCWLFATPIAYPSSLLSEPWRTAFGLNPMAGVAEGFRWALLGTDTAPGPMLLASSAVAVLMLATGVVYFRRAERSFADVV